MGQALHEDLYAIAGFGGQFVGAALVHERFVIREGPEVEDLAGGGRDNVRKPVKRVSVQTREGAGRFAQAALRIEDGYLLEERWQVAVDVGVASLLHGDPEPLTDILAVGVLTDCGLDLVWSPFFSLPIDGLIHMPQESEGGVAEAVVHSVASGKGG